MSSGMSKKQIILRNFSLVAGSVLLTYLIINKIGHSLESFETRMYQEFAGKKSQYLKNDSTGIPVVVYEGKLGEQYNCVAVAERAIKWADQKDTASGRKFLNCIHWLMNNYSILNDSSYIFYDYYNWPAYKMTSPWRSAMNQGRAMQAFIRAFEKTRDSVYLDYARRSMNVLYTEVKDGGVTYKDSSGYWYEEYADDSVPQTRVLNGMIVTLQGLSDYYKLTGDPGARFLFMQGVKAVRNSLPLYDHNGHSNYDILGKPAKLWYHSFHIRLLEFLYSETRDPLFNEYRVKWSAYKEPSYLATLIMKPTRIGVFVLVSLFITILTIVSCITAVIMKVKHKKYPASEQNKGKFKIDH